MFSYERARADTSQLRAYANASGMPKKIDDLTVEFTTNGPNPIELEHVATINIMSRAWCEANRATKPQNFTEKEDMITAHQANGTGPYMLKSREPDIKTVLVKNPNWWGIKAGLCSKATPTRSIYLPIVSDATRMAALMSGEVDLVNDPPPQDVPRLKQNPDIKVLEGSENRIVFIGMDQKRDELLYSSVKGKNPFKDKRVRQALYQAIDIEAIKSDDDARPVAAVGRAAAVAGAVDAGARKAPAFRQGEGEAAAGRSRLPERLRGHARLPEQPLRQRREDLPGAGRDVGADRRHDQRQRDAARQLFSQARKDRHQHVHARLGRRGDRRRSSSCSRCCRPTPARATATTTTAATPIRSSTS